MRTLFLALAFALLLPAMPAPAKKPVSQCLCAAIPFEDRWEKSDAVFTGVVTDIKVVKTRIVHGSSDLPVVVLVTVDKGYKGAFDHAAFLLYTNMNVDSCMGYDYKIGGKYLFYAYMRRPEIREAWSMYNFPSGTFDVGGLCGGTAPVEAASAIADLAAIPAKVAADPDAPAFRPTHGFIGEPTNPLPADLPYGVHKPRSRTDDDAD